MSYFLTQNMYFNIFVISIYLKGVPDWQSDEEKNTWIDPCPHVTQIQMCLESESDSSDVDNFNGNDDSEVVIEKGICWSDNEDDNTNGSNDDNNISDDESPGNEGGGKGIDERGNVGGNEERNEGTIEVEKKSGRMEGGDKKW